MRAQGQLRARHHCPAPRRVEAHDLKGKALGTLERIDDRGLFEGAIKGKRQPIKYHAATPSADWWVTDAYSFGPVLGPIDDLLIAQGIAFPAVRQDGRASHRA